MPVSNSDNLPILSSHLVKISNPLQEGRAIRHGRHGTIVRQCQDRNRLASTGKNINPLMPVFQGKIDPGVPGNTSSTG
jgi:hypothetical protein